MIEKEEEGFKMVCRNETIHSDNWPVLVAMATPILTLLLIIVVAVPAGIWQYLDSIRKFIRISWD